MNQTICIDWVASLAEAWIEIARILTIFSLLELPPSRRRGLKYDFDGVIVYRKIVASLAEAWIEMAARHLTLVVN